MKISELLIKGKAVIADPAHWTQGYIARDAEGRETYDVDRGVCFCSIGALAKVNGLAHYSHTAEVFLTHAALTITKIPGVAYFNDTHTHDEVMQMWDKAIASAIDQGE